MRQKIANWVRESLLIYIMYSNDPQTTLLNLDSEEFTTKYYSNVEPWDGNYDMCLHKTKAELPKKVR